VKREKMEEEQRRKKERLDAMEQARRDKAAKEKAEKVVVVVPLSISSVIHISPGSQRAWSIAKDRRQKATRRRRIEIEGVRCFLCWNLMCFIICFRQKRLAKEEEKRQQEAEKLKLEEEAVCWFHILIIDWLIVYFRNNAQLKLNDYERSVYWKCWMYKRHLLRQRVQWFVTQLLLL
jgi:hypothetical protein